MKQYSFSLFFILLVVSVNAQRKVLYENGRVTDISSTYEEFKGFYLGGAVHSFNSLDKNFLSEGYQKNLGYDLFSGFSILGLDLELGMTVVEFDAIDPSITGGFIDTRLTNLNVTLAYPLYNDDVFLISAFGGGGSVTLYNTNYRVGRSYDRGVYSRDKAAFLALGARGYLHIFNIFFLRLEAEYNYHWTEINTPQRVQDLYKDLHSMNLNLGLVIRFRGRPIGPNVFSL